MGELSCCKFSVTSAKNYENWLTTLQLFYYTTVSSQSLHSAADIGVCNILGLNKHYLKGTLKQKHK